MTMSNMYVKSKGVIKMPDGKKIKGILVANEKSAQFCVKEGQRPIVEFAYSELSKLKNVRRGGVASDLTITLKSGESYEAELVHGLKLHSYIEGHWEEKPVQALTRGAELSRLADLRGQKTKKARKPLIRRRHPNRSIAGDFGIYFMLFLISLIMAFPLVFAVGSSLKPLDELFRFPPPIFPQHPTMDNFFDLFVSMSQSWVPFSRYLGNTVLITVVGTFGHLVVASLAAFALAKYDFPGGKLLFNVIVTALMFSGYVTGIPNYVIMSKLGFIDTYWALLLPAFGAPIGLFLMKQFMEGLPTSLIEAANIDGAGVLRIFWSIVMPNVKPAWLTVIIFSVQGLWNTNAHTVIYSEAKKTLVYALQQIQAGGIARTGQAAAVTVIVMIVPIITFIVSQSGVLETMASSGLKD